MIIRKLQEHFPARLPEWFNSFTMFAWGAYILLHPGIFNNHLFDGFVEMAGGARAEAERVWGLVTVVVGMIRAAALFVNGTYSKTPMIRLGASAISAFVWSQVVVGLLLLGIPTTGVVMYSAAVCLDLVSAYRASWDVVIARDVMRREQGADKRGKSVDYSSLGVAKR